MTEEDNQKTKPCNYVLDLANKVNTFDKKIDLLDAKVQEIDKKASISEILLEKFELSHEKTIKVLETIENTMQAMKMEIFQNSENMKSLAETVKNMNEEVKDIRKKSDESEDKFKIDWRLSFKKFFEDKLFKIILSGGILTFAWEIIKWIIETKGN